MLLVVLQTSQEFPQTHHSHEEEETANGDHTIFSKAGVMLAASNQDHEYFSAQSAIPLFFPPPSRVSFLRISHCRHHLFTGKYVGGAPAVSLRYAALPRRPC